MNIVFIEANHDSVTSSVHRARRTALQEITNAGGRVVTELFGAEATSAKLTTAWRSVTGYFNLLSGMGHGCPDEFCGQNDATVYDMNGTALTAKEAIVHLFSCNCAQKLGAHLVAAGAKAFIGYTGLVSISDNASLNRYFVMEAAAIDKAIVSGKSSADVKKEADRAYDDARIRLMAEPTAAPEDVAALEFNHAALVGPWSDSKMGSF